MLLFGTLGSLLRTAPATPGREHVSSGRAADLFSILSRLFTQHPWLKQGIGIAVIVLAAWLLGSLARRGLRRWMGRLERTFHHSLVQLLDRIITPVLVLAVITLSFHLFPLSANGLAVLNRAFYLAILGVILYYAAKAALLFLNLWLGGEPSRESLREPIQFTTRVLFVVLGTMIVLENLGIRLTALWTTLGVGSVALALALQDTLSNFFAGVYLRVDNPVRLQDYVKLESGQEGFIIQRGWRSTRIRTLQNNVVVVPNSKLASTIVINYTLPEPPLSLVIGVSVAYDADPDRIERLLVEEATQASKELDGLLSEPEPFVRLIPGFGNSSLDFSLICRVKSFTDQYLVQHELRKRILKRFRNEGIDMASAQPEFRINISGMPIVHDGPQSGEQRKSRAASP